MVQSLDDDGIHQLKQSVTSDLLGEKFTHEAFPKLVFRWVPAQSVKAWRAAINAPSTGKLEEMGLLATEIKSARLQTDSGIILQQKKFTWGPRPAPSSPGGRNPLLTVTWERRVAIALGWVQVNLELLGDGLCLTDAHLKNWMYDELMRPVWVDFGSIQGLRFGYEGLKEFREKNLSPVELGFRYPFFLTSPFGGKITAFQRRSLALPIIRSLPNPLKRVLKGY